jgi:hypothetical protein
MRFIILMGVVSLFADMTYEGARSVLGPFLGSLGGTAAEIGLVAGFGEMLAAALRLVSGRVVDRTRAYWTITIAGYVVNLVAVPAMALAGNWKTAALLIIAERTGKGLRGPARDVLLSGATEQVGHGWGFGIHTALDQAGAVTGPLLVMAALSRSGGFAAAFGLLAAPAGAALAMLAVARAFATRESAPPARSAPEDRNLPSVFWWRAGAAALLAFGTIDFALLAYHFERAGLATRAAIPLLYAGAMGVDGLAALAFGSLFDRFGLPALSAAIAAGMLALPLGMLGGPGAAAAAAACWGIGMGAQDACLRPAISQVVSMNRRGAGFGAFHAIFGITWFLGSAAMGALYQRSLAAVVVLGVAAQMTAAAMFLRRREH